VGQPPLLYQTFQVHQSEIRKVVLSENSLISGSPRLPSPAIACDEMHGLARWAYTHRCFPPSVCACDNHVRTWRIARFRGRISTQPGSQALSSFSVPSVDPWQDVGA
jgi:hypothetical protein